MNFISQLENGIFASKKDLEKFSKNENAKILVISDSHGAKETFLSIVQTFGAKADALIFAGDGIFDLLFVIEKAKNHFSTASWLPPVIAFAKGNNDPSFCSADFSKDIIVPPKITMQAGKRTILVSHGHSEGVYYDYSAVQATAQVFGADTAIFGHTHVPAELMGTTYIMNPGSISLPRHRSSAGFAMLEITGKNISPIFYRIENGQKPEFIPYHPEQFYG